MSPTSSFHPEVVNAIQAGLDSLGGAVFPKLNWSAPKDATWVALDRTLKCTLVRDVLTLLKSSGAIANNIADAVNILPLVAAQESNNNNDNKAESENGTEKAADASRSPAPSSDGISSVVLVLKKWSNLYPSREFRVFVAHGDIVAVSQRDLTYYPELETAAALEPIRTAIADFHHDFVRERMRADLAHYVYDVYVDTHGKVWVVDVAPFDRDRTNALLFDWDAHLLPLIASSAAAPGAATEAAGTVDGSSNTQVQAQAQARQAHYVESYPLSKLDIKRRKAAAAAPNAVSAASGSPESKEGGVSQSESEAKGDVETATSSTSASNDSSSTNSRNTGDGEEEEDDGFESESDDPYFNFAMRVLTSEHEEQARQASDVAGVMSRLPSDGVDVSDASAIERFIALQNAMRMQKRAGQGGDDSESSDDDNDDDDGDKDGDKDAEEGKR